MVTFIKKGNYKIFYIFALAEQIITYANILQNILKMDTRRYCKNIKISLQTIQHHTNKMSILYAT